MAKQHFVSNKNESVRIFHNPILDKISYIDWWQPLLFWLPVILFCLYMAASYLLGTFWIVTRIFAAGFTFWTFAEYILHRFLFHYQPKSTIGKRIHFIIHGVHHDYPNDAKRLVMPPLLAAILALPFYFLFHAIFGNTVVFYSFSAGFLTGYLTYEMMHYTLHHANIKHPIFKKLKQHHMIHHFQEPEKGFGVSSKLWDIVFKTTLKSTNKKIPKDVEH